MQEHHGHVRRVTLELGGKSPNIFSMARIGKPLWTGALSRVRRIQGEVCSAGSRILVEKKNLLEVCRSHDGKSQAHQLGAPFERATSRSRQRGTIRSRRSYLEMGRKKPRLAAAAQSNLARATTSSPRFFMMSTTMREYRAKKFLARWLR